VTSRCRQGDQSRPASLRLRYHRDDIASFLPNLGTQVTSIEPLVDESPDGRAAPAAEAILTIVRDRTGVDLRAYRRTTVLRRMHGRMTRLRIGSLDAYRDLLEAADEEAH
jgi:hypothetical protein